jgi:pimeloyl-ACP methyl ester carboxylesterase
MRQTNSTLLGISLLGLIACGAEEVGSGEQALSNAHGAHGLCEDFNVPVAVDGVPGAQIYAEYCVPPGGKSNGTLLLMVHTSWHNHYGYDPPNQNYSHVRAALDDGFMVLNIDRLGTGQSTLPPSDQVTIDRLVTANHGVVEKLRDGSLTGTAHDSIVFLGSSFAAEYAWFHAGKYPADFDGYVLQGIMHRAKLSFAGFALSEAIISVCEDPVFSLTFQDCGYLVNRLGLKGPLYYHEPFAAPGMIDGANWDDRLLRDVISANLLAESTPPVGLLLFPELQAIEVDPATAPSQAITKPTLLVIGDHDPIYCGGPEGFVCNEPNVTAFESPYYTNAPVLDVYVPPETGHLINLHRNGPEAMAVQNQWVLDNIVNP